MARKVCNICFEGKIPPEVLVKAAITRCGYIFMLPMKLEATVYYDPGCSACKRLFQFIMDIGNLCVRARLVHEHIIEVLSLAGTVAVPITVVSGGKYMRGCPAEFTEFLERLCNLLGVDISSVQRKGHR